MIVIALTLARLGMGKDRSDFMEIAWQLIWLALGRDLFHDLLRTGEA